MTRRDYLQLVAAGAAAANTVTTLPGPRVTPATANGA